MRYRIYRLLRDGGDVAGAARNLKITRQSAWAHAEKLEEKGVLVRDPTAPGNGRTAIFFRLGPKALEYQKEHANPETGGIERLVSEGPTTPSPQASASPAPMPVLGSVSVHGGRFKCRVDRGPATAPRWEKEWRINGATCRRLRLEGWRVVLIEGDGGKKRTVAIDAPPVWTSNPEEVRRAKELRLESAHGLYRVLADRFGFAFAGFVEEVQATELAIVLADDAGDAPNVGTPGRDPAWIDGTPPPRSLETTMPAAMAAFLSLPQMADDLRAVREQEKELMAVLHLLVDATQQGQTNRALLAQALVKTQGQLLDLAKAVQASAASAKPPDPNDPGVM